MHKEDIAISTKEDYIKRVEQFIVQLQKKGIENPTPLQIFQHVLSKKADIARDTWRQYKNATVFVLSHLKEADAKELAEKLSAESNDGTLPKAVGTSSAKRKNISEALEIELRNALSAAARNDPTGDVLVMYTYVETILATGMRPVELSGALLIKDEEDMFDHDIDTASYSGGLPMVRVRNAKATQGRSFGQYRHIDCTNLTETQLLHIEAALGFASAKKLNDKEDEDYKEFYSRLRKMFYRFTSKHLGRDGKNVTFYTFRHQCIADLKHAGLKLHEIAAIVGHGSDATSVRHYGKKRYGRNRGNLVMANSVDAAMVKRHHTSFNPSKQPIKSI